MAQQQTPVVREIGVPVKSVNWVHLFPAQDGQGKPYALATMGQQAAGLFVLQIDPETGRCRQFVTDVPSGNYPTATLMSRSGQLYIGAAYAGHLLRFDPSKGQLIDLGAIHPSAATFPCRLDEDSQGRIWIGSYGTADLTRYDPDTGEFTRYGRMDNVDMYNYPWVDADGRVACLIRMTEPHVVVLDPETGEKRTVGPTVRKGEGTLDLQRGNDGHLYILSSEGNYRLEGFDAVPVDTVPPPQSKPVTLSDGSRFNFADAGEFLYRKFRVHRPDGEVRVFDLDYEVSGSDIFYVHLGPDGRIYGSSVLPLHLFRYDPGSGELDDLGKGSAAGGEAYSMGNLDGKLYIAAYPGATLSVYDPDKPYHFGGAPGDNPRDLGRMDEISYRPRTTLTGPLGRVWTASLPDYGRWGGPLSWYDPNTGQKGTYYRIWGDGSCYTLAYLPEQDLIAVGTNIAGGTGTLPKVKQAALFFWDYRAEQKVWEGTLDRPVSSFNALLVGADGLLYGTVQGNRQPELFAFDPAARRLLNRVSIEQGTPLDLGLRNGPDGQIYGFTGAGVYRYDPRAQMAEPILQERISVAGPLLDGWLYFATGHRLRAMQLP